jgi:integrase
MISMADSPRIPVDKVHYPGLWHYEKADGRKQYGRRVHNRSTGKDVSRIFPGCFDEAEAIALWNDENGAKTKRAARQRQTMKLGELAVAVFDRMEKNIARPQASVKVGRQGRRKRGVGSANTLANYRADDRNYIQPYFKSSTYIHEIDAVDIEEWLDWMREQPGKRPGTTLAEQTLNAKLTVLRNHFNYALRHGAMDIDVMQLVDPSVLPDQNNREDYDTRALWPDELLLLIDAPTLLPWERNLVTVLAFTGMRRSEVCALQWGEVDQLAGLLRLKRSLAPLVKGEEPKRIALKNKWERSPLILPIAAEALFAQRDIEEAKKFGGDEHYAFTADNGRPIEQTTVTDIVKRAGEKAGLGDVTPKTLRRTAGTIYANVPDIPDHLAALYMGHTVEVFHANYVVPYNDAREHEKIRKALIEYGWGVRAA